MTRPPIRGDTGEAKGGVMKGWSERHVAAALYAVVALMVGGSLVGIVWIGHEVEAAQAVQAHR